jgi:inosine/xanthosine triphosphatase
MHVGVGSTNPVKVAATRRALGETADSVAAVDVDPGVPEQPRGVETTVRGAQNRARRAHATGEYDLGVGIEGGVAEVPGTDRLCLVMWAAATDGDRLGRGGGPSLPLPAGIADRVRDGAELGPVMDEVLGRSGVKREEGAAGALTGGHTDRERALAQAVAASLGPFVTDHY